jgi:hypothetical protein
MEIRRKNRIKEELQFFSTADADTPALVVEVDINTDEMGAAAKRAWDALGIATVTLQKGDSEGAREEYGQALVALFGVIFGAENAAKILEFYEGREGEMLVDLEPFFTDTMSKIIAGREARMAQFLALAGKHEAV